MTNQSIRAFQTQMSSLSHPDSVTEIDRRVGARIRDRRVTLGLSQQHLATMVGVSTQQEHKYEHGINRITAGRLWAFAHALDVSLGWLFDADVRETTAKQVTPLQRSTLEIARLFATIEDASYREALLHMARALSPQDEAIINPDASNPLGKG